MSRSTLITGGAGFIGCALARRLVAAGDVVTALDVLHPQVHAGRGRPERLPDEVELVPGDVTVASTWDAVLKLVTPDRIVHLAAETGTGQSLTEASRHGRVNVVGTTEMLDAVLRADAVPAHIVLASSRAVYGEGLWESGATTFSPGPRRRSDLEMGRWDPTGPDGGPARPLPSRAVRTPPRPTSVYGATKLAQENVLTAWCAATGSALSVLRLQNVYGPGQSLTNAYTGIVSLFGQLARGGEVLDVYEDGRITRDFVFIEDVADALVACLDRPPAGDRTLDVGSGAATTILDLATTLAGRFGAPTPKVSGKFRHGDVRAGYADITVTSQELGYRPAWPLARGLDVLLEWMEHQPDAVAPGARADATTATTWREVTP